MERKQNKTEKSTNVGGTLNGGSSIGGGVFNFFYSLPPPPTFNLLHANIDVTHEI